jgi:hypothetical protein
MFYPITPSQLERASADISPVPLRIWSATPSRCRPIRLLGHKKGDEQEQSNRNTQNDQISFEKSLALSELTCAQTPSKYLTLVLPVMPSLPNDLMVKVKCGSNVH